MTARGHSGSGERARSVLVTGGNSGIGLAAGRALAECGHRVALTYRRERPPSGFLAVQCDVTDDEALERALNEVTSVQGAPEIVVANAGVRQSSVVTATNRDTWDTILATNITAVVRLAQASVSGMLAARWGRIILISSIVGFAGSALQPALSGTPIDVVCADVLAHVPKARARLCDPDRDRAGATHSRQLLVIAVCDGQGTPVTPLLEDDIEQLASELPANVELEAFFYDVLVYTTALPQHTHVTGRFRTRMVPPDTGIWSADLISALADFAEVGLGTGGAPPAPRLPTALAIGLHAFLTARAGAAWEVGSYPGSVTARFIEDLEKLAVGTGNFVLRSPNEHGLAAGAMARWLLDGAPFILSATSGMVDEFRGTLANLKYARARGFLLFADVRGGWFPFQGTVHEHENSNDVFRARGLAVVELRKPEALHHDLATAFAEYDRNAGPVVLMVSPAVLAVTDPDLARAGAALSHSGWVAPCRRHGIWR